MSIVISIIGALLVLSILVVVHEGGHYFMGKWLGFRITEFSVGMGPKLLSKKKHGTEYNLRAFPIGGMCAFYGEDQDTDEAKKSEKDDIVTVDENKSDDEEATGKAWNEQPAWKRLLVALAGPLMNIVLAFVLAALLMCIFGEYRAINLANPMISAFAENAPAQAAGLEEGDIITKINGKAVSSSDEMIKEIRADEDGNIDITILRPTESSEMLINGIPYTGDGTDYTDFCKENPSLTYVVTVTNTEEMTVTVNDTYNVKEGRNMIGATITEAVGGYEARYNVLSAWPAGARFVGEVTDQMFKFLGSLFTGGVNMKDVSGIVGVVDVVNDGVSSVMEQDASAGQKTRTIVEFMLYLAVLLSINLGIINLLPLPALDGGRIIFNIIEIIAGRVIPMKVEGIIHTVGLILLLGLIAVITVKDVIFIFIN